MTQEEHDHANSEIIFLSTPTSEASWIQEVLRQARHDLEAFGLSAVLIKPDGTIETIDPKEFYVDPGHNDDDKR